MRRSVRAIYDALVAHEATMKLSTSAAGGAAAAFPSTRGLSSPLAHAEYYDPTRPGDGKQSAETVGRRNGAPIREVKGDGLLAPDALPADAKQVNHNPHPNRLADEKVGDAKAQVPPVGFFQGLARYIQPEIMVKFVVMVLIFGQGSKITDLWAIVSIALVAYLHEVGLIADLFAPVIRRVGAWIRGREHVPAAVAPAAGPEPGHGAPAGPPARLGRLELLERFLVGFIASLLPWWEPRAQREA